MINNPSIPETASATTTESLTQTIYPDITYAEFTNRKLKMDILIPTASKRTPLVVIIHGGAWRQGNRKDEGNEWLLEHGYAIARIEYRYSNEAVFPAQIHDCKGALRWLRAHAEFYGYNPRQVAVLGTSSGGHLALLMATTEDQESFEGDTGGNLEQSSSIRGAVAYCPPTDFILRAHDQPQSTETAGGQVHDLLGGPSLTNPQLAAMASPAKQVHPKASPSLILHGTLDQTVLPNQALAYAAASIQANVDCQLCFIHDTPHWGEDFRSVSAKASILHFLANYLSHSE